MSLHKDCLRWVWLRRRWDCRVVLQQWGHLELCLLLAPFRWFCRAVRMPWGSILALSDSGPALVTTKLSRRFSFVISIALSCAHVSFLAPLRSYVSPAPLLSLLSPSERNGGREMTDYRVLKPQPSCISRSLGPSQQTGTSSLPECS